MQALSRTARGRLAARGLGPTTRSQRRTGGSGRPRGRVAAQWHAAKIKDEQRCQTTGANGR
eukprot:3676669-Alexandrium_andersonii.AAC.1